MISNVRKSINAFLAGLIAVSMIFTVPVTEVSAASDATVNLKSEKQLIKGFGGINHPVWIDDLTVTQRETAFGNGNGQLGFSILRIHVDENKDNWAKEVATAQAAIKNGAIVFASPWNPPASMCETVGGKKRLKYDQYGAYTQHLNDFVAFMKENGVELYAISVQNEPDYAHEWTWWSPQEMLNYMKNYAGKINCKVMAPESFQYLKNISDPILNDATALANMDILGAHLYGTQVSNFPYPLFKQKGAGKELWMTEVYVPNSSANSADNWPEALDVAQSMHNSMVEAEFQAYVWWYIRRSYGPMKEDGTMSKRGAMMAHYSKFVRPGYVRVDATKSPNTNVYVSAYKGDNKVVIVAINKGNSAVSQKFALQNATSEVNSVETFVTTSTKNVAAGSPINVSAGSFTAQLPAQSVTTFVGSTTPVVIEPISAFNKVEAENYNDQSGIEIEDNTNDNGKCIGYIQNDDYAVYKNIDFGDGATSFQASAGSNSDGGNIEIRLDSLTGTLVGTCTVSNTAGWKTWADVSCDISKVSGKHDVYLKFTGGSDYLMNLDWFKFDKTVAPVSKLGDINSDDSIDALDLMLIKKHLLGAETIENTVLADLDASGTVDAIDFALLKQYLLKIITTFPAEK